MKTDVRSWRTAALAGIALAGASLVSGCTACGSGAHEISAETLRGDVEFLSADAFMGREAGTEPERRAARAIADRFAAAGLEPLPGEDGLLVPVELYRPGFDVEGTRLTVGSTSFAPGVDFEPFPFSGDGDISGEVVFAGYGITAPEYDWDDYDGLDVTGRVVLVMRHEPGETDPGSSFDGEASTAHAQFRRKVENAIGRGASALLLYTDPLHHDDPEDLRMNRALALEPPRQGGGGVDIPALHVSRSVAEALLADADGGIVRLQERVDAGESPAVLDVATPRASIAVRRLPESESVTVHNVVGVLPGAGGPDAGQIWIGAHHDHIGGFESDLEGDTVFNGADDNASGTAVVMALADAFAARKRPPHRSIVFATWSAEEKGLLGSRAFVERDRVPVDDIDLVVNLDMLGRNSERPIDVVGDGYATGLRDVIEAANEPVELDLNLFGGRYFGNSDHDPFYRRDVPFLFLFTGTHEDYHGRHDHADKLDYERMEGIARLAYGIVDRVADAPAAPAFIHHLTWLGVVLEPSAQDDPIGGIVKSVDPASRAAEAGIDVGDVVVGVGDTPLAGPSEAGARLKAVEPGSTVAFTYLRAGATHDVSVERARPGFLGIVPGPVGEDLRASLALGDADGILVRGLTPAGPAAAGGVAEGDVIVAIADRPVGLATLRAALEQIGGGETVSVVVMRDGKRHVLDVTLGTRPRR